MRWKGIVLKYMLQKSIEGKFDGLRSEELFVFATKVLVANIAIYISQYYIF